MASGTRILVINGPNLNRLGHRDPAHYGNVTLAEIENRLRRRAADLGLEVDCFQSNSEGAIIDCLQERSAECAGVIINPGALTNYGLSLRDALVDTRLPVVEVHLSNIAGREPWRARSVIAPIAVGQVTGMGWRSYLYALDYLASRRDEGGSA